MDLKMDLKIGIDVKNDETEKKLKLKNEKN